MPALIVKIICYLYVDLDIREKKAKELIGSSKYLDKVNTRGESLSEIQIQSLKYYQDVPLLFLDYPLSLSNERRKMMKDLAENLKQTYWSKVESKN